MIQQTITLTLGGKERTLLYGVMGYFSHIRDASGIDPFEYLQKFDKQRDEGNITVLTDDTAIMIYAGLNSYLDSIDGENIPFEKVRKWCNGVTAETITDIFKTAFGVLTPEPGELKPSQEQQNGTPA